MGWPAALTALLGGCVGSPPAAAPPLAPPPVVIHDPGPRIGQGAPRFALPLPEDRIAVATSLGVGVWPSGGGAPLWFAELEAEPLGLSATPDGQLVGAVGSDGWLHVWREGAEVYAAQTDGAGLALAPDGARVAYSAGGKVRVNCLDECQGDVVLGELGARLVGLAFDARGARLAGVDRDGIAAVWRSRGGEVARIQGRSPVYSALAWSPDGRHLALAGSPSALWTPGGGLTPLEGPVGPASAVGFNGGGARVAVGGQRGGLVLCDGRTGARLAGSPQGQDPVGSVAALGEGWLVVSGAVARWAPETDTRAPLVPLLNDAGAVALSDDGETAAVMSRAALMLASADGREGGLTLGLSHGPRRLVFNPRGQALAVTAREAMLVTPEGERIYRREYAEIYAADLRPDGAVLALAARDGSGAGLRWLDGWTGDPVKGPVLDVRAPSDLRWSPDGSRLVILDGGVARVIDAAGGGELGRVSGVGALAWSPSAQLALVGRDGGVQRWSAEGTTRWPERAAGDVIVQVAWSPEGGALAVLGQDTGGGAHMTLFDAATGRGVALAGVGDVGHAIGFSPDGGLLFGAFGTNPQADGAKPGVVVAWDRQGGLHRRWDRLSRQDWWSLGVGRSALILGAGDGSARLWSPR